MADIKLMVMYPCPHDIRAFETLCDDGDMPMRDGLSSEYAMSFEAFEKLYHEEHVPMIESSGGKETLAHAGEISSGGAPTVLLAEEQTFFFGSSHVWNRLKAFVSRH